MSNQFPEASRDLGLPEGLARLAMPSDMIGTRTRALASHDAALSDVAVDDLPPWVDHSVHVTFIRDMGSWGCGLNALAACWDILLAKYCFPFIHPNISVNRMLWAHGWTLRCWPEHHVCDERMTLPIPGLAGATYPTLDAYLAGMGCPTEGTELTNSDAVQWPTAAGNEECPKFRMARHAEATGADNSRAIAVELNELRFWLKGGPVRAELTRRPLGVAHFVALVGYDDARRKLKFLNCWGDQWGENGFGYLDYDTIGVDITAAQVFKFVPPPPVPCARIRFTSQRRQDVSLWVGVAGTQMVKRVWPSDVRDDNSKNLWFTVALPPAFVWPPSPQNRLFLDVYDQGAHSGAGGAVLEFSAHLNDQHRFCTEILKGTPDPDNPGAGSGIVPRTFKPQQMVRLTIG